MKWSWKIGTPAGIELRIHATFLLLPAWVAVTCWMEGRGLAETLGALAFLAAVFACVVLHELGHCLAARQYGIPTRDITLLPVGGLARLERLPATPRQELWVAAAGPLVNVAIAAALFCGLALTHRWAPLEQVHLTTGPFLERLMVANVWLVLFNLIPAFPMDGGRLLRALLAMRLEYARATGIAAAVGKAVALLFAGIALFGYPTLLAVAFFVWIGASQEAAASRWQSALREPLGGRDGYILVRVVEVRRPSTQN